MTVHRVVPNLFTEDPAAASAFYTDFLGLDVGMEMPGMTTFVVPEVPSAQLSIGHAYGLDQAVVSIGVDNVDEIYARAQQQGLEIVYELRDEPWGVRRFFVKAPGGHVINVVQHA
ncbi:VOC family protein [Solirubrobacter sp. CPCC 204708]|uniref:VOC family protein n=1 Tax=Solirubrobacter deserti TaxID=2282478 RepID=A0ABT4RSK5_9ACTN|nr:VOC family protein [Solirubrobacter deserti]MBE2314810.1 VOC family protein [Solirubrobacter deserti]MDA0141220.1 VOC family protein [Solirubrobacter deserti]